MPWEMHAAQMSRNTSRRETLTSAGHTGGLEATVTLALFRAKSSGRADTIG